MMQECYGVCGRIYDRNLENLYTNRACANLYKTLLLGRGRGEAILKHAAKSDVPMIVSDWAYMGCRRGKNGKPEDVGQF
ncbi:MAG: hypothetical protein ACI4PO_02310 [Faecousia sp.]